MLHDFEFYALLIVLMGSLAASFYSYFLKPKSLPVSGVKSFYDIVEKNASEHEVSFDKYKGKVVYGVNVASNCGRTEKGYNLINKIASIEGVQVLLFPCNQFLGQEPGSNQDIVQFCSRKSVPKSADIFDKGDVNGPNTRLTYKYLKEKQVLDHVWWNFNGQFIVDKKGNGKHNPYIYLWLL